MTEQQPAKRTAAEIEAELERTRAELTRAVDALADRVDPRRPIAEVKNKGKAFAADLKAKKPAAIATVTGATAAVGAVVALLIVRSRKD